MAHLLQTELQLTATVHERLSVCTGTKQMLHQRRVCVFVISLGDKVHTCVDWLAAVLMRVKIVKAQVLPSVH